MSNIKVLSKKKKLIRIIWYDETLEMIGVIERIRKDDQIVESDLWSILHLNPLVHTLN